MYTEFSFVLQTGHDMKCDNLFELKELPLHQHFVIVHSNFSHTKSESVFVKCYGFNFTCQYPKLCNVKYQ